MELTDLYLKPEEVCEMYRAFDGNKPNETQITAISVISVASANHAVKKVVEQLEAWQRAGTHLVSREAIEALKKLVKGGESG